MVGTEALILRSDCNKLVLPHQSVGYLDCWSFLLKPSGFFKNRTNCIDL